MRTCERFRLTPSEFDELPQADAQRMLRYVLLSEGYGAS